MQLVILKEEHIDVSISAGTVRRIRPLLVDKKRYRRRSTIHLVMNSDLAVRFKETLNPEKADKWVRKGQAIQEAENCNRFGNYWLMLHMASAQLLGDCRTFTVCSIETVRKKKNMLSL